MMFVRNVGVTIIAILVCSMALSVAAQPINDAKANFNQGKFEDAAVGFGAVMNDQNSADRAEAAAFLLRSYRRAGQYASLVAAYDSAVNVAKGTPFEAECGLERAIATFKIARKADVAYEQLTALASTTTGSVFAASGARFWKATIELERFKDDAACSRTLSDMLQQIPDSPYEAKALFMLLRCNLRLTPPNPAAVAAAHETLIKECPDSEYLPDAELRHADFDYKVRGDKESALKRWRDVVTNSPNSDFARSARLRINELAPLGFEAAIADYTDLTGSIRSFKKFQFQKHLCQKMIGIYHYQLGRTGEAKAAFEALLAQKVGGVYKAEANKYLRAIADPKGVDALACVVERAGLWHHLAQDAARCYDDMKLAHEIAQNPAVMSYIEDPARSPDERGDTAFNIVLATHWAGNVDEGILLAHRIINDFKSSGRARGFALYHIAQFEATQGNTDLAAGIYRRFVDERFKLLPQRTLTSYFELARIQETASRDYLGAMLTLEELRLLYGYRVESQRAAAEQDRLAAAHPEARLSFEASKLHLIQKLASAGTPIILAEGHDAAPGSLAVAAADLPMESDE